MTKKTTKSGKKEKSEKKDSKPKKKEEKKPKKTEEKIIETGSKVKLHYKGTLEDGTLFDDSSQRGPLDVEVGSLRYSRRHV